MEHQQFRRQAAMIVLDSYGKKVIEDCKNGFDREIKEKLYVIFMNHTPQYRRNS